MVSDEAMQVTNTIEYALLITLSIFAIVILIGVMYLIAQGYIQAG